MTQLISYFEQVPEAEDQLIDIFHQMLRARISLLNLLGGDTADIQRLAEDTAEYLNTQARQATGGTVSWIPVYRVFPNSLCSERLMVQVQYMSRCGFPPTWN